MKKLELSGPLGSYEDKEEFQVDRTLVWVEISSRSERQASIDKANELLPAIWDSNGLIISVAEQALRKINPAFWSSHDSAGTTKELLSIWGITINPDTGLANYHVGCNFDFEADEHLKLPHLNEEISVYINRCITGETSIEQVYAP